MLMRLEDEPLSSWGSSSLLGQVRWGALGRGQDGLHRAPSFQPQPKGSCKILFENHPSEFSPHLEDVGLTWHWVFDAIDSEDNRGQSIDCKT